MLRANYHQQVSKNKAYYLYGFRPKSQEAQLSRGSGLRASQRRLWRGLSQRKDNAANFARRVVTVGGGDASSARRVGGGGISDETEKTNDGVDDPPQSLFVNNAVKSSKYTVWSFLPR